MFSHFSHVWLFCNPMECDGIRLLCPWDSPGKNIGVGCHFLLQGVFLTQKSSLYLLCLLHCRRILYPLSHMETPVIGVRKIKTQLIAKQFNSHLGRILMSGCPLHQCMWYRKNFDRVHSVADIPIFPQMSVRFFIWLLVVIHSLIEKNIYWGPIFY